MGTAIKHLASDQFDI